MNLIPSSGFSRKLLVTLIYFFVAVLAGVICQFDQLPNCQDNFSNGLILVSTLDGKFSVLNAETQLLWQIDTGPGPLLTSNIHNLELTNNGQWIRIIPSLSGVLYKFDGQTVDQIPISADTLLKSSFKYSDDLVIAGGLEVRTYGVGFRKGTIYYTCSLLKCNNVTDDMPDADDILIIERSTQTVRAIEPRTGSERWNFSVGVHNIKLHQVSCLNPRPDKIQLNISAILPEGLLRISNRKDKEKEIINEHVFSAPIVNIWKWDGATLNEIDLFSVNNIPRDALMPMSPAIYVGMHNKQLYIREFDVMKTMLENKFEKETVVVETTSVHKIPWKPVPASALAEHDESTALSVLYASDYINGNGYYLFTEDIIEDHPETNLNGSLEQKIIREDYIDPLDFFILMGRETLLILSFTILFIFIMNTLTKNETVIIQGVPEKNYTLPLTNKDVFSSRYLNDFDTLRCLGKGGFGVVFEVKQKIDECNYAIKRITLPTGEKSKNRVLREVKALAKLDHQNIVRYFNSWVESPPYGWQDEYDKHWIKDITEAESESDSPEETANDTSTRRSHSVSVNIEISEDENSNSLSFKNDNDDSLEIVFESNGNTNHAVINTSQTESALSTDMYSENKSKDSVTDKVQTISEHVRKKTFWREASRLHHSWDASTINRRTNPKMPSVYLYIQMQLCQKESLKEWLKTNHDRKFDEILNIFKQILSAVEYVHLQGLIHRDLKPSNIFFSLEGQVKVGDFGLVKDMEENLDMVVDHTITLFPNHTKNVGTYLYMSPEQLKGGNYNHKVDIYSLGLIFFELLVSFSTDMERICELTNVRNGKYPPKFANNHPDEHCLLQMMLCEKPEERLTTIGIKAKPPLNCPDSKYGEKYFFELPK